MTTNTGSGDNNTDETTSIIQSVVIPPPSQPANTVPPESQTSNPKDNGILDFMSVDRAIELYNRIHSSGIPELDWKFYGRSKPCEPEDKDNKRDNEVVEKSAGEIQDNSELLQTEFDFDEEFGDIQMDTPTASDSLQLKKRPEQGSEKKTNLSDIMSDIMKETSLIE